MLNVNKSITLNGTSSVEENGASETALSNVIFMSMCKVHLNGLNLTEVIITNAASVREYAHILPY